jgi:hypothetical protein
MLAKAKLFLNDRRKEVVIFILFFLISTISFALGHLSAGQSARSQIVIEKIIESQ